MDVTLAAGTGERKHMFGFALDSERTFDHDGDMHRTYVRRRVAALTVAFVFVLGAGGPLARALGVRDDLTVPVASRTYVVRSGDTLWSIARAVAPDRDPREVIHRLAALDPSVEGHLRPGQVLAVPVSP
jgi:hypothetical protein